MIGAGAAGLAAASELARAGRSVLVLEARERIGGRCWTLHEPAAAAPIELGAEFIHGSAEITRALLRRSGAKAVDSVRVQRCLVRGRLRPVDGFAEAKKAVQGLLLSTDISFGSLLQRRKLSEKTKTMARLMVEGFDAADPRLASARAIAEEWAGGEMGASQPRPQGGYGRLLAWLAESVARRGVQMKLQAVVERVSWGGRTVEVEGRALGRSFEVRARHAVVTLPLGVLQAGRVRFAPALAEKRAALRGLVSGPVVKGAFVFHSAFWEARHRPVAFFHSPGAAFPTFWTQLPRRAPLLIGWAGGPKARALSGRPPRDVVGEAIGTLEALFGRRAGVESMLQSVRLHDWSADPHARGAYSYVRVGGAGARQALAAPLRGTLFFAGEATDSEQAGTVAGALQSGIRAARELLKRE